MTDRDKNLPIESHDDAILRMLSGATFGKGVKITLPSGAVLSGDEAAAFSAAFELSSHEADPAPAGTPPLKGGSYQADCVDNPLSSVYDDWTGDPQVDRARLVSRAMVAAQALHERERRQSTLWCRLKAWWQSRG